MVSVSEKTVFPFPREKVWRLMVLHMDDEVIRKIHPSILNSKQLSREGNKWVFDRRMHSFGRTFNLTWRFELKPMESVREEVISSTGGLATGSFLENIYYAEDNQSTWVITRGEITPLGFPDFLQKLLLRRTFGQIDREDLDFLSKLD